MADKRAERIAELIRPLRVKPGSKVNLARDFDPGYKADLVKKKVALLVLWEFGKLAVRRQKPATAVPDQVMA